MNKNTDNQEIPDEVLELLPWYATGSLSPADTNFFEQALSDYPSLRVRLEQEHEMIQIVSKDNSLLDLSLLEPQEERLKAVFNIIDAEPKPQKQDTLINTEESLFDKIKQGFNSFLGADGDGFSQYARAGSVAVLVISLAVLTAFIAPLFNQSSDFLPASSGANTKENTTSENVSKNLTTILLVGFKGSSVDLGANKVLENKVAKIESIPTKEGMYQISFKNKLNEAETKEIIAALMAQKELVWFAGEEY